MADSKVGTHLKQLREARGLSPQEVAKRAKALGYTLGPSTVYEAERGFRRPEEATLRALADVYELTYDVLVRRVLLGDDATSEGIVIPPRLRRLMDKFASVDEVGQVEIERLVDVALSLYRRGKGRQSDEGERPEPSLEERQSD